MRVQICKGCGTNDIQDNKCPICIGLNKDSGEIIEVEINENELVCCYCGKPWKKFKNQYKEPPFMDINKKTFYCGCMGWE